MTVRLDGVCKKFGEHIVLENLSFEIPRSGITVIQGPSGSGKTTLLNIIAGIAEADEGTVLRAENLRVAYAFQDDRLLPWSTALGNVALVCPKNEAVRMLEAVGLAGAEKKLPCELSGGMRRRVNIARALAAKSDLLLLDEPFQGLDPQLKKEKIAPLITEYAKNKPVVLVTHESSDLEYIGKYTQLDISCG